MKQSALSRRVVAAFLASAAKTKIELELPETWHVTRTRAGSEQRAQGAFSWFLHSDATHLPYDLGGFWPASLCARPGGVVLLWSNGNYVLVPPHSLIEGESPFSWRLKQRMQRRLKPPIVRIGPEARAAFRRFYG